MLSWLLLDAASNGEALLLHRRGQLQVRSRHPQSARGGRASTLPLHDQSEGRTAAHQPPSSDRRDAELDRCERPHPGLQRLGDRRPWPSLREDDRPPLGLGRLPRRGSRGLDEEAARTHASRPPCVSVAWMAAKRPPTGADRPLRPRGHVAYRTSVGGGNLGAPVVAHVSATLRQLAAGDRCSGTRGRAPRPRARRAHRSAHASSAASSSPAVKLEREQRVYS